VFCAVVAAGASPVVNTTIPERLALTFKQTVEADLQLVDVVVQIQQENAELRATAVDRQVLVTIVPTERHRPDANPAT
jgi:methionine-rich copper-binding protein CopC